MNLKKLYIGMIIPSLILVWLIFVVNRQMGVPYEYLVKEPSYIGGLHPFAGILSNIGVLGWCVAASVSIFSWLLLRAFPEKRKTGLFLLYFGLLSIWLLLDDFLLFHESLLPKFGIQEPVTVGAYGLLVLFGLTYWRNTILKNTPYTLLIAAFVFFALSVLIDHFSTSTKMLLGEERVLFEDGFKFIGIVHWLCYFGWISLTEVKQSMALP